MGNNLLGDPIQRVGHDEEFRLGINADFASSVVTGFSFVKLGRVVDGFMQRIFLHGGHL